MNTFSLSHQRVVDFITVLDNLPKDAIADNKTYRLRNNALTDLEEQNKEYSEMTVELQKKIRDEFKKELEELDIIDAKIAKEKDKIALQTLQEQKKIMVSVLNKKSSEKFKNEQEKIEEGGKKGKTFKLGNEKFNTTKKLFDEHGFKLFNDRKAWGEIDSALEAAKTIEE